MNAEQQKENSFTITPQMSEFSRKQAAQEAIENAQRIVKEVNAETESLDDSPE